MRHQMEWLEAILPWVFGPAVMVIVGALVLEYRRRGRATRLADLIEAHFRPTSVSILTISERQFPHRVRADLQRSIDRLFKKDTTICHFCGVRTDYAHEEIGCSSMLNDYSRVMSVPAQYEEIDIGEDQPIRCL